MAENNNQHIPEFMTKEGSTEGIKVRTIKFYPEDTAKMAKMSLDEMYDYKSKLIEDGKYTYEESN